MYMYHKLSCTNTVLVHVFIVQHANSERVRWTLIQKVVFMVELDRLHSCLDVELIINNISSITMPKIT